MKKGFTLIELLAVIIILAVIALITTPVILNVVENAKEKSRISSVNSLIDATRLYMSEAMLDDSIDLSGNLLDIINNRVKGTKPDEGEIRIDGNDIGIAVKIDGVCYIKDYSEDEIRKTNDSDCVIYKVVEATCYGEETEVIDTIEINYDGCIDYFNSVEETDYDYKEEELEKICKNEKKIEDMYYLKNYIVAMSMAGEDISEFIDNNIIEVTYKKECQTCFEYEKNYSYEIDYEECMNSILAEEFENEDLKKLCAGETITVEEEEISIKDITDKYESMLELYMLGIIKLNYGGAVITNYLCYEGNELGLPTITDVVIPTIINGNKAVEIADISGNNYSFASRGLTSVDFSNARYLEKIGIGAFIHNKITNLKLLNNVTTIGYYAFFKNSITQLEIGNGVVSIGISAFDDNQLPDDQAFIYKRMDSNGDGIAEIDDTVLVSYGGAKRTDVIFPSNIEKIENTFDDNDSTTGLHGIVDLSKTKITEIGAYQFQNAGRCITSIRLPKTIEKIGFQAFYANCFGELDLSNLTNLTTIDTYAFYVNHITSIKLPNSVIKIGNSAFAWNQISGEIDLSNLTSLTTIDVFAFASNQVTSVKLPSSIATIDGETFSNNQISGELDLSYLTNLTTIGYAAFRHNQITSVKIPNSVTRIENNVFSDNSNLTLIEIDNTKDAISGAPWGADNAEIKWLRDGE